MKRAGLLTVAIAALLAGAASAGEISWWNPKWKARRSFKCTGTRSELAGDEVAVVEFLAAGLAAADGHDVRVLAGGRKPVPVKVLSAGPGDFLRVAFPLVKEVNDYHVYYGNPEAGPAEDFEPERGVLLESRAYRGGEPNNWAGMQAILRRAGPVTGASFVDKIFLGYNPVGPETRYVNKYTAWLKCPAAGEYVFATSSDDASFLLLDGKQVAAWPGWHGAVAQARHTGKAELTEGLHKLEYHHVNGEGEGIAVAAWQPPGGDKVVPIPASAFAPVSRGERTGYALRGETLVADFEYRSAGEAYIDETRYLVRAAFNAFAAPGIAQYTWDFGDGQTGTGRSVEHVYVTPGLYEIKLTAASADGKAGAKCANHVEVDRDMARAAAGQFEKPRKYAAALAGYDLAKLSPAQLEALSLYYVKLERPADRLRLVRVILKRGNEFSDEIYFDHLLFAAHELREDRHAPDGRTEAIEMLNAAEDRFRTGERRQGYRARVIRERGDVYYFYMDDLDKALNEYDAVVTRFRGLEDNIVRVTKIRLGDIHRDRGQYDEAAKRYREAEALKLHDQDERRGEARRGALPQIAQSCLHAGQIEQCQEALDIWEWEYPLEKLSGHATLLRSQLELRRKKYDESIKQIEVLLKVNPRTAYAGELLMIEALAYKGLGGTEEARKCYARIVEDYPESEYAERAREMLKEEKPEPKK